MVERSEQAVEAESGTLTPAEYRLVMPDFGEAPSAYSNFMQATLNQHDLTMYFGWYGTPPLSEAPTEPVNVPVRPVIAVSIPLGIVRGLIRVLESQASAWEESTGQELPRTPPLSHGSADKKEEA